ncbi:hypothetical protein GCM10027036_03420 [Flavihumibacter cheonanensis]
MRSDSEMRFKGCNKIFIRLVLQLLGNIFNGELVLMQQLNSIGHFKAQQPLLWSAIKNGFDEEVEFIGFDVKSGTQLLNGSNGSTKG